MKRSALVLARVMLPLVALVCGGCYAHSRVLPKRVEAIAQAKERANGAASDDGDCEVWMRVSYSRAGDGPAKAHYELMSPAICVKQRAKPLDFPGTFELVYDPRNGGTGGADWRGFGYCEQSGTDVELEGTASDLEVCEWNGNFRDSYPLDFELWTTGGALHDLVQLIQVFRNGELVFKWSGTESSSARVAIDGDRLTANGLPHLADFDLRIFPAGVQVDEFVLKRALREHADPWRRRLQRAGKALYEAKLDDERSIKDQLLPVRQAIDAVNAKIAVLAGEDPEPQLSGAPSPALPKATGGKSLLERYRGLEGKASGDVEREADQLLEAIRDELGSDRAALRDAADRAVAAIQEAYARECATPSTPAKALCTTYANAEALSGKLAALDGVVEATLQAVDDTIVLARDLRQDVLTIVDSTEVQAKLYNQVVASLAEEGDFFDPYVANPAAVGGEAILPMRYSDSWQLYGLQPWNGAAFRPEDSFASEPGASYAVPILDLLGMRYQWDRSRWAQVLLGAGAMYFEDADAEDEDEKTVGRFAAQVNLSIGVLRVGAAYVPDAETRGDANSKWRVLIGADLFKLITGNDLQVKVTNL